MEIFVRGSRSPDEPGRGFPAEVRILAVAAAVVSVVGLAILGVTWI